MLYYVIEMQSSTTGSVIPFVFTDRSDAEAKYHSLLAVAAKSEIPKHGVMMIDEDGSLIKVEVYPHDNEQPE